MLHRGAENTILAYRTDDVGRQDMEQTLAMDTEALIVDAGDKNPVTVTEPVTVNELLKAENIWLVPTDEVAITSDDDVDAEVIIKITRIHQETRVTTKKIEFESTTKNDSSIYKGERKVVTKGKDGKKQLRHWVRVVDGEDVDKEQIGRAHV